MILVQPLAENAATAVPSPSAAPTPMTETCLAGSLILPHNPSLPTAATTVPPLFINSFSFSPINGEFSILPGLPKEKFIISTSAFIAKSIA